MLVRKPFNCAQKVWESSCVPMLSLAAAGPPTRTGTPRPEQCHSRTERPRDSPPSRGRSSFRPRVCHGVPARPRGHGDDERPRGDAMLREAADA
jgi:hypothetical protein